jgi:predicted transcriptional regulator
MPRAGAAEIPPPLELECLKVLWDLGEGTVRDVRQRLAPARPLAYTTVMTVLERLVRRGAALRRKAGRSFVYTPQVGRDWLRRRALRQLIDSLFNGSEADLRACLESEAPGDHSPPAPSLDPTLL